MRKLPAILSAVVAGALLLGGCAPQLDRIETGLAQNTEDLAAMRAEQQRLRQEIEALNELLRLGQDAGLESEAQRSARLGQLSRQIDELMQRLDDNLEFSRSLSARVDLLARSRDLEGALPPAETPLGQQPQVPYEPLPEEGRAIFNAAQLDRSRGNLDLAREGFRDFLQRYPASELADDALYQLGDLAFSEGENQVGLEHFDDLLARYPQTEYAPAALLKSAFALEELGRPEEARDRLEQLVQRYPDAPEADLARERLGAQ